MCFVCLRQRVDERCNKLLPVYWHRHTHHLLPTPHPSAHHLDRFNRSAWSMQQNSMVLSFLSYCDALRPRYFLMENVRTFVTHNDGETLRLTLRTLLDMGYQVGRGS